MMKKFKFVVMMALAIASIPQVSFAATQVDALLKKLEQKGILTSSEVDQLKGEIENDEKAQISDNLKSALPSWVQKMKLKGDFRTRFQWERKRNDTEDRKRGRIRLRFGVETEVAKNIKAGFGLATGSDDPRSTNQTLENSFETPDIRLDYAFGEWQANDDLSIIVGKFSPKDYLWQPADMLWDGDINVNGGAVSLNRKLTDEIKGTVNFATLIIDENGKTDSPDPHMKYAQGILGYDHGNFDAKVASTYYMFDNIRDHCPEWTAGSNSGVTAVAGGGCTGGLAFDYNSIGTSAEVGVKKLFGGLPFGIDDRIALIGQFIHNFDPADENQGWTLGMKFGKAKLKKPGDWQVKYLKVKMERDAWPDFLPDSDRLSGKTNVHSHEVELQYLWKENVTLGLDYYKSNVISGLSNVEHLVQADVLMKF